MYDLLNKNFHIARFPIQFPASGKNDFQICKVGDKGLTNDFLNEFGTWGCQSEAKSFNSIMEAENFIYKNNFAMLVIP